MPLALPPDPPPVGFPELEAGAPCPPHLRGGLVAIGNFDGVHRGHQHVLADARALAVGRPLIALTFEPHPRTFFAPTSPVPRLTDQRSKTRLLAPLVDAVAIARFDAAFAKLSAEEFIRKILRDWLDARQVVCGPDFRFGAGRSGDSATIEAAGLAVTSATTFLEAGQRVSSSAIRKALAQGDIPSAARALGRGPFFTATVIHGRKEGRQLGYPTANMALDPTTPLAHGIYAVRTRIRGTWHDGVASFGRRPTFDNGAPLFEVFVFDFADDLYGVEIDVVLVSYIRPERKFSSLDALISQMDDDSAQARAALTAEG